MEHSTKSSQPFGRRQAPHRPVRSAVVGSGGISKEHLSFLGGKSAISGAASERLQQRIELAGVCDLSPVSAAYARDTFGATTAYGDLDQMLEELRPDVVHILTPPETHLKLSSACLAAGAHVICEKPITTSAADLDQLLAAAEKADRWVMESHNYRFNSGVQAMLNDLADGRYGSLREVEVRIALPVTDPEGRFGDPNLPSSIHALPAGVLHDFTTHFAYLFLLFAGQVSLDRVAAAWGNYGGGELFTYDNLDALIIGSAESGPIHGRLRFDAQAGPDTFSVTIRGTKGWAETDLFQPYVRNVVPRPGGSQLSPIVNHVANGVSLVLDGVANVGKKIMQQSPYEGLHRMLGQTYRALVEGGDLPVSEQDMRAVANLVDALLHEDNRL